MTFQKEHPQYNSGRTHFHKGHIPWNTGLFGKGSPNFGKKCSEKTRKKISLALIGKKTGRVTKGAFKKGQCSPFKGKRHTFRAIELNRQKHIGKSSWNKGITGKSSHSFGHKNYIKDSEKRKEYARMGSLALFNKKGPTSIERKVYQFLEDKGIPFEKQKLIKDKFLVDAFIPSRNLIIECDGEYWHNLDKIKKQDRAKDAYLFTCGFNLLRLKESEIMNGEYERSLLKWL